MRFLTKMLDAIFPPHERALRARSVSYRDLVIRTDPIRIASVSPPVISLLPYKDPLVQAAITEAKFHDAARAQEALGAVLADYLAAIDTDLPIMLIPVPLSRKRYHERGYNQVERVCRSAFVQLAIPDLRLDTTLLQRSRDTPPQTSLGGRERRMNLKDAFILTREPDAHTLYIVIDDVTTTGATLLAAIAPFQDAEIAHILPLALAHSP